MQANFNIFILFVASLSVATAISIPVNSQHDKCMIVYSSSSEDYLKIDLKFSKFGGQTDSEYYRVLLINTQTNQEEAFNVTEGLFRRQIQLTEHVLYRLCIKIILNRYGTSEIQQFIEYNSAIKHRIDEPETINIPTNLLKIKDLSDSYSELSKFDYLNKAIKQKLESVNKSQDELFKEQQQKIKKIEWITIIQFIFIAVFGAYQYFRLRNIIHTKQTN